MDRIKGREAMRRLFRFMRKEDETVTGYCTRTARAARTMWNKMKLPFLFEMIAGNMWSAMGWTCASNPNAVHVEVRRWPNTKARNMTVDPTNHTRWKHKWWWHNRGCVGQDCFGTGWTRRMEQQEKKMSEFGGQEGLCDLRTNEREALGRTRTPA